MLALLSGCAQVQRAIAPPPPPVRAAPRPPARPPRTPPAATPLPSLPAPQQAVPETEAEMSPSSAPPAAPLPPISLARLSASRVEAVLGPPATRTASGAGQRWGYRAEGCTLDLFLFPDIGSGGLVVLDRRANGASEQECIARLRNDRH